MVVMDTMVTDFLTEVIEKVCKRDQCPNIMEETKKNAAVANDLAAFRTAKADDTESVIGERVIASDSDDDSEEEFNRILETSRLQREQREDSEDEEEGRLHVEVKTDAKLIEHEYDSLPPIEQLNIHVVEDIPLEKLGEVTQIVDCIVVVESDPNTRWKLEMALDFDTVLFDSDRNAVGQVFDVFGSASSPLYAVRFNSPEEAQAVKIGTEIFYAPGVEQFTRTVLTEVLKKQKIVDAGWDGEGECPDDEIAFSDDEAEKRYMAKHRHKKQNSDFDNTEKVNGAKRARGNGSKLAGFRKKRGRWGWGAAEGSEQSRSFDEHRVEGNVGIGRPGMAWPPNGGNRGQQASRWRGFRGQHNISQRPNVGANRMSSEFGGYTPNSCLADAPDYCPQFGGPPSFSSNRGRRRMVHPHKVPRGCDAEFAEKRCSFDGVSMNRPSTDGKEEPSFVDTRLIEQ